MTRLRAHLTYANVVATLALFLVVAGGGAYAAKKIKLKNNSVTTPKIKDGAVTAPKLAPGVIPASQPPAAAAGDVKVFDFHPADGQCTGTAGFESPGCTGSVLSVNGMNLNVSCRPTMATSETLDVNIAAPAGSATNVSSISGAESAVAATGDATHAGFGGSGLVLTLTGGGGRQSVGTIVYRTAAGTVTTIDFSAYATFTTTRCEFYGTATTR